MVDVANLSLQFVQPDADEVSLQHAIDSNSLPGAARPLVVSTREARLLHESPWSRSLGKLTLEVTTEGWKFPAPPGPVSHAVGEGFFMPNTVTA